MLNSKTLSDQHVHAHTHHGLRAPPGVDPGGISTAFAIDPPIKGCWVKLTLCGK